MRAGGEGDDRGWDGCKIPVDVVVKVIKNVLYTGKIGDGKIFVYDVENVIKIRTNEEGYDALQDDN